MEDYAFIKEKYFGLILQLFLFCFNQNFFISAFYKLIFNCTNMGFKFGICGSNSFNM